MDGNEAGPGFAVPNVVHWLLMGAVSALTLVAPVRFVPSGSLCVLSGVVLAAAGAMIWLWGRWAMSRRGISADPSRAPSTLLEDGPYRFSRNPTYLGLIGFFLGGAIVFDSAWLLGFAAAEFLLAHRQVRREESYLTSYFGEAYVAYRSRVRRWL